MAQAELDVRTAIPQDDMVLPFAIEGLEVRGRIIRLGPALDAMLHRHDYPPLVSALLGKAVTLGALLGTTLKFDGRFILQTQSDGPVDLIVVDFTTPDRLRAYARFDAEAVASAGPGAAPESLLGAGHLAMTVDRGGDMSRYQGIVALEGGTLEEAAHGYFLRSEQIPSRLHLAVAEAFRKGTPVGAWRSGGILIQHLPKAPRRARDLPPGDVPEGAVVPPEDEEDDAWTEATTLLSTVEDHELLDPGLAPERLLYRLFHERGVRVFERRMLHDRCRCSREAVDRLIRQFTPAERADMVEDGEIRVTCEFCNARYRFDPKEFEEPGVS
jgi:molecular chaperone Hsp33